MVTGKQFILWGTTTGLSKDAIDVQRCCIRFGQRMSSSDGAPLPRPMEYDHVTPM